MGELKYANYILSLFYHIHPLDVNQKKSTLSRRSRHLTPTDGILIALESIQEEKMKKIFGNGGKCRRAAAFSVIIISILISFSSCVSSQKSSEELLSELAGKVPELPYGTVYLSDAEEGESSYADSALLKSLYGESATEYELPLTENFAIYLSSFASPCEIAVFKCYSASDTEILAGMCFNRIEQLSVLLASSEFSERVSRADVRVSGRFVIMTMLP